MSEAVQADLSVDQAAAQIFEGMLAKKASAEEDADEPAEGETPEEQEETPEGDAEGVDESEETDEPEEETEAPAEVETLSDLAKQLDVPIEELTAKLKHTVKVDGEELQVTLDDLVAGHQRERDYTQKTQALSREREAFVAQKQETFQQFHAEHTQLAQLMQYTEQQLVGEINSQELAQLRQTQPEMWAARRLEIQDRVEQLRQVKQAAANQYMQRKNDVDAEEQKTKAERMESERKLLVQKIPDLDKVKTKLAEFAMKEFGYTAEDLSQVADHRLFVMARDAMLYRESQAKALSVVKNKVIPAPQKALKPTKPMGAVAIKRARLGSAMNALKKSGSIDDAAKYILASGKLNPKGPRK